MVMSAKDSFSWMSGKLGAGELVCLSGPEGLPDGVDRASLHRFDEATAAYETALSLTSNAVEQNYIRGRLRSISASI